MWGCERLDRYGKIGCLRHSYRNDSRVAGLNQNATRRYVIGPATANTDGPYGYTPQKHKLPGGQ